VACPRDALNDAFRSLSDTNASFMASLVRRCGGGREWQQVGGFN
jgi:hypothetical protein